MHKTPKPIFDEIARERPRCERAALLHDHICSGRSTMEHVWTYSGRQIDQKWAIIRLCEFAHSVGPYAISGALNKEINRYLSLRHATPEDLKKYPKIDWAQLKKHLTHKYDPTAHVYRDCEQRSPQHSR